LEGVGADGKIILKWILGQWGEKVWTVHLAQDTDQWLALVNTVMKLRVPQMVENFLTS
jgi:hypothetical protein